MHRAILPPAAGVAAAAADLGASEREWLAIAGRQRAQLTRLVDDLLEATLPGEGCVIDADPARVAQILGNLLHNASKFTPGGGTIRVVALEREHEVELRVEDSGIGIEAAQLQRLFEPFVQLDAGEGRSEGGLGIGLALVRRLAELHGGRAEVASEGPGRGAAFSVTLPRCARPDAPSAQRAPAGA